LPRGHHEEDEDRYIAFLEAKLTSGKRAKSSAGYLKDIESDGLGDLLGGLDEIFYFAVGQETPRERLSYFTPFPGIGPRRE